MTNETYKKAKNLRKSIASAEKMLQKINGNRVYISLNPRIVYFEFDGKNPIEEMEDVYKKKLLDLQKQFEEL